MALLFWRDLRTLPKKTMANKDILRTEQVLDNLKKAPDDEQEYTRFLGGILHTTHWLIFDPERNLFGDSKDWPRYSWYTEAEFMERFAGALWRRDD